MARARNLKPGFFKNEDLAECSAWARLCFAGLWTLADREGRLEDRPKRIKGELFAFDSIEVEPLLVELATQGFILRYRAGTLGLIQVLKFWKHQNPHHKEPKSAIASPQSLGLRVDGMDGEPEALSPSDEAKAQGKPEALAPKVVIPLAPNRAESLLHESGTLIPEKKTPSVSSRGSRLPTDWVLPKAWGEWAITKYPHWPSETVRLIAESFSDHWWSKAGKDATKVDWQSAWRKWCGSDITQRAHPPSGRLNGNHVGRQQAVETHNRAVGQQWLQEQEAQDAAQ